jgi:hypothetical protein
LKGSKQWMLFELQSSKPKELGNIGKLVSWLLLHIKFPKELGNVGKLAMVLELQFKEYKLLGKVGKTLN